ncbi:DUF1579 domain-containing protein [Sphingomonas sp. So64.6b]|uniref:DUF1579 domain-containing protein n=1 Tax=Sphingomonas sp. So64.6b TaxID=2997354 RepID=UPI001FCE55A2|nr:DUF1579 domain-containing protein [Sphingomonas sp. So64.6b]
MTKLFSTRPLLLAAALLASAPVGGAVAQVADNDLLTQEQAAIGKLSWMDGTWRGPATTRGPGGEHKIIQTERIGNMLGGTIKVIEGKGFNPDGSVGFNAFAVISYDPAAKAYGFRSYAQGRSGTFVISPTADGYVWEIPAGGATIRYTAILAKGVWTEVGDRIVAGEQPQRFFEMVLTRVGDSDWPAAGSMTRK